MGHDDDGDDGDDKPISQNGGFGRHSIGNMTEHNLI
jgi:hypothetical protein